MGNNEFAVLTVKGWDGSRILGLFSTMDEASKVRDEFRSEVKSNATGSLNNEEFYIDIVQLGEVSKACEIYMGSNDPDTSTTTRKHIYD